MGVCRFPGEAVDPFGYLVLRLARFAAACALLLVVAACEASSAPEAGASEGGADAGTTVGLDGASNDDGSAVCQSVAAAAEYVPPVVQLVLDISGSMADDAAGGGGSKWTVTRKALNAAINGPSGLPDVAAVGIGYFPGPMGQGGGPCFAEQVGVALAQLDANQRQAVTTSLASAVPSGPTPTHDAYFFGGYTLNQSKLVGNRFLVLVTDGEATHGAMCSDVPDADALVALVADGLAGGNATFVVGSPGSENARNTLSRMAVAGGTARPGCAEAGPDFCHFDMTTSIDLAADLGSALGAIVGATLGCDYELPPAPDGQELDHALVNVAVTSGEGAREELRRDTSGTCGLGWDWSPDSSRVVLCGADCDRVKQDPAARVDILFGCRTKVL